MRSLRDSLENMEVEVERIPDGKIVPIRQDEECPNCGGLLLYSEKVPVSHPNFGKAFPCLVCEEGRKVHGSRAKKRLKKMIPGMGLFEYKHLTFDSFDELSERERDGKMLARYAAEQVVINHGEPWRMNDLLSNLGMDQSPFGKAYKSWLVLAGDNGLGKTGFAGSICNAMMPLGYSTAFVRVDELIAAIQKTYDRKNPPEFSKYDVLQGLNMVDVLVLDEMGTPREASAHNVDLMSTVVRGRHSRNKLTIITTNHMDQKSFSAEWGRQCSDVVFEMAWYLCLGGINLRLHGGTFSG